MSRFNSDFWEIPVPPETLDLYSNEDQIWYDSPFHCEQRDRHHAKKQKVLTHVREIIEKELTPVQRRCVRLYFFEGRTQEEIATIIGISRRVVSQHLFGVKRAGKQIGGAINRIRKLCGKRGILL
ncbi:MAG: sigma factor-like helix-turn-helix DNA-binding protein [Candidatus Poribacteria bacterium]|nr:sigma factor-like helix-turn-helix DNA-binding protein [Candidatus Poribacteria bacterium]